MKFGDINWKQQQEAAKKAGDVLSYQVLTVAPRTPDDPDQLLVVTYGNWAAGLDRALAKGDAIEGGRWVSRGDKPGGGQSCANPPPSRHDVDAGSQPAVAMGLRDGDHRAVAGPRVSSRVWRGASTPMRPCPPASVASIRRTTPRRASGWLCSAAARWADCCSVLRACADRSSA
jgi:hypothetical protein